MVKFLKMNSVGCKLTCMSAFIASFLCVTNAFAQTSDNPSKRLFKSEKSKAWSYRVDHANRILKGIDEDHSKEWAVEVLMNAVASDSSAKAMNSLGMAYMNGLGVNNDMSLAVSWLEMAGCYGYLGAYYNLGMIFKNAQHGVEQDFEKSFDYFSLGAAKGSVDCVYAKGYMLYKGLGCKQDYIEAFNCFMKAAKRRHQPSLYMIGLCYRNGYGVEKNEELGIEYLYRSAMLGYRDAKEELERPNAENYIRDISADINIPKEIPEVSASVNDTSLIAGHYNGFLAIYDWSGQFLLSEKPMSMTVQKNGATISGQMFLGTDTIPFLANLTEDQRLDFTKGYMKLNDRYITNGAVRYKLVNVLYDIWSNKICGKLNLYSVTLKEPDRPMYFELHREGVQEPQQDSRDCISITPNPFENDFTVQFELEKPSVVKLSIFNVNGTMAWQQNFGCLEYGKHELFVTPKIKPGRYVLNVVAANNIIHSIIVKEGGY